MKNALRVLEAFLDFGLYHAITVLCCRFGADREWETAPYCGHHYASGEYGPFNYWEHEGDGTARIDLPFGFGIGCQNSPSRAWVEFPHWVRRLVRTFSYMEARDARGKTVCWGTVKWHWKYHSKDGQW